MAYANQSIMSDRQIRVARLFKNGRSQAIRIPKEMEFSGAEVTIEKRGAALVLTPVPPQKPSLADLMKTWKNLDEDWPDIPDGPARPVDL
jgi:antitoxin VapB